MMNFVLGAMAGALIVGIAAIAAARNPDIQQRLGLFPAAPLTLMAAPQRTEPACPPPVASAPTIGSQEMLFNRRRFWSVAP